MISCPFHSRMRIRPSRKTPKLPARAISIFSHIDRREDLHLRARLYRPHDGEFEIAREVIGEITGGIPREKGSCQYKFKFNGEPPVKDGKYLLVVECADVRQAEPKWIGSASQLMTFVE
jgi:hypothetical protein